MHRRSRKRESQAGSTLSVQSPMWGLNSGTMRSWPKLKSRLRHLTEWATQLPQDLFFIFSSLFSMQFSPANSSQLDLSEFSTSYPQLRKNDAICLGPLPVLWLANSLLPIHWINWGAHRGVFFFPPLSEESISCAVCWPLSESPHFHVLSGIWGLFKVRL